MNRSKGVREQPWWVTAAAVGGLLGAIIVVGVVGLLLNQRVKEVTEEALRYDVELEDKGDDLRVAVLDLRHFHRNIAFGGVSRGGVAAFEGAYEDVQTEIDELEDLGVRDRSAPQPEEFRRMADDYYAGFRPAIGLAGTDQEAFDRASDEGLREIELMENAAAQIDALGEELSADALQKVERANANGTLVLLAVIVGLVLSGAVLAYAAVRVMSELRRLYAEQQETAEKLAAASRAKTDFIADVSHELRTPLTVLRGNAQVGLALGDDVPAHREILEDIVRESRFMSRMVEDLLLLARSDSASLPLNRETVAAAPFLAELAGRAEILVRERDAELETRLESEGSLEIDPERVAQAVLVLVDNAAKYGPPGGRITLSSEVTRSGELHVKVEDRGPGIPREDLPRVFERFYRVDKARSRRMGGTGLGLPIAKTIVEAHGGHITAESRPGKGTRMSLYLPLLDAPRTDDYLPAGSTVDAKPPLRTRADAEQRTGSPPEGPSGRG
ncbi:MAG: hypothetical protein H0X57_08015 [Rubrobacter sp.]|nr:hypothetical protein [Rubrobacter sp.]